METPIGGPLGNATWRWIAALAIGIVVIAADFCLYGRARIARDDYVRIAAKYDITLTRLRSGAVAYEPAAAEYAVVQRAYAAMEQTDADAFAGRALLTLGVLLAYGVCARGDWLAIGLRVTPVEGWRWWSGVGCRLAVVVPAAAIPIGLIWRQCGWGWDSVAGAFTYNEWPLSECCVRYPVFEEMLYRLAVCVPVAARFGRNSAIAASGVLFGTIHVIYDALNPVNVIAGFLLAWAFLKSGSIAVPILLHALGNLLFWVLLWAIGPGLARLLI